MNIENIEYDKLIIYKVITMNNFSEENKEIIKYIFINNESQSNMAKKYNKTDAAISQLCKRFKRYYLKEIGYTEITILVPKHLESVIKKLYQSF